MHLWKSKTAFFLALIVKLDKIRILLVVFHMNVKISYKIDLLDDNSPTGLVKISNGFRSDDICYICNRENVREIIQKKTANKQGIYILFNEENEVYVGQTNNVDRRTKEHLREGFWTQCVLYFSEREDKGLNRLDLDIMERFFIREFSNKGIYKVLNETKGNSGFGTIDDDRANWAIENLKSILSLFGLLKDNGNLMPKACKKQWQKSLIESTQKTKAGKKLRPRKLPDLLERIGKQYTFCKCVKYSSYSEKKKNYWFSFDKETLKEDLDLCLIDSSSRTVHVLRIPANTFDYSEEYRKGFLHIRRKDVAHGGEIDIKLKQFPDLDELVNNIDFSRFLAGSYKY